ncbi:MAG: 4,5-DOPA dioxygenase extradiol [Oligoflexales bacterium]|nr:4,5-DOPA dioxygenase extradiol [Oligoflexales bacterium]
MKMPVVFIGHGSPMNAISSNSYTQALASLPRKIPTPRAVLCISAHWLTSGTYITRMAQPRTIYDFHGFPKPLFEVKYPALGSPEIADEICKCIVEPSILPDEGAWGLDHGSWAVLRHMYPKADIPILQLSIDKNKAAEYHFKLGQQLKKLRSCGILILGSGNIVHNLNLIRWGEGEAPYPWAQEFDEYVKAKLIAHDSQALVNDFAKTKAGQLSVPTTEHYDPLLYVLGASDEQDALNFEFEGFQNASISMRSLRFG